MRHDFRLSTWTARSGRGYCANACNKCSCRSALDDLSARTGLSQKKLAWIPPNSKVLVMWHEYTDVAHFQTDYQPVAIPARSLHHFSNATVTHNCLCVWIPPLNSTVKTQNAKRAFQNARSERRGEVIVVFGSQKPPIIFFGPCKKDPLCHTNSFNQFSRSVSTTELIALRWNLWEVSQNLFLSVKKRIREGILTCPTNLVRPETFLLHPKKDLDLGRSAPRIFSGGFIHHFEPIRALKILFYFGGKRFQCPGPGNT